MSEMIEEYGKAIVSLLGSMAGIYIFGYILLQYREIISKMLSVILFQ